MSIYFGASQLSSFLKGQSPITEVYKGSQLVYRLGFDPVTFTENGSWVVPTGIKQIRIDCVAGQGQGARGGNGGRVQCILKVSSGLSLSVFAGKQSVTGSLSAPTYNASDIRINGVEYSNRVIVAGGGGNQANSGAVGGAGGGLVGGNGGNGYGGDHSSGKGGTQDAGGAGGTGTPVSVGHYHNGSAGTFGLGGGGSYETGNEGPSGGGGAGWYGGGGGAGDWNKNGAFTAGGGGGSSYADPNLCTDVVHTQGFQTGNGYVTISMV